MTDIEGAIREAMGAEHSDLESLRIERFATYSQLVAGLAAATRLILERARLPEGWEPVMWSIEGFSVTRIGDTYHASNGKALYPTLADAVAACDKARAG